MGTGRHPVTVDAHVFLSADGFVWTWAITCHTSRTLHTHRISARISAGFLGYSSSPSIITEAGSPLLLRPLQKAFTVLFGFIDLYIYLILFSFFFTHSPLRPPARQSGRAVATGRLHSEEIIAPKCSPPPRPRGFPEAQTHNWYATLFMSVCKWLGGNGGAGGEGWSGRRELTGCTVKRCNPFSRGGGQSGRLHICKVGLLDVCYKSCVVVVVVVVVMVVVMVVTVTAASRRDKKQQQLVHTADRL